MLKRTIVTLAALILVRPAFAACTADCDGNGSVDLGDLFAVVNVLLGNASSDGCTGLSGEPAIAHLVNAVTEAQAGNCNGQPTPVPGCEGGFLEATFTNVSGTNAYEELSGTLQLTKVTGAIFDTPLVGTFGSDALLCPLQVGVVLRRFQIGVYSKAVVGTPYPLKNQGLLANSLAYIETPTLNPLGTRGWKASSGTLTIDSIAGDTVTFHVSDAQMVPEPSFSFQTPATGTFTLNITAVVDKVIRSGTGADSAR